MVETYVKDLDEKYKNYTEKDTFPVREIAGMITLDHGDVLKTEVEVVWVGFEGWTSRYSIGKILQD